MVGARIGYSLTRRFAFEAGVGYTSVLRTTYVLEQIFGLRLEEERFDLFFYEAGGSMDILPGRRVTPFLAAGGGASVLGSHVEPTWSLGLGTKMFVAKRVALRWELRDHHLHGGNRGNRARPCRDQQRPCTTLSEQAGQDHPAVYARLPERRAGPPRRTRSVGASRPARGGRQSAGWRRSAWTPR